MPGCTGGCVYALESATAVENAARERPMCPQHYTPANAPAPLPATTTHPPPTVDVDCTWEPPLVPPIPTCSRPILHPRVAASLSPTRLPTTHKQQPLTPAAMTDAAPSPAMASNMAPSPSAAIPGQHPGAFPPGFRPPMPGQQMMPGQPSGAIVMDDEKRREILASLEPSRVNALRKVC